MTQTLTASRLNKWLNKIVQGNCLELMPKLPDRSIDMILADVPYGTTACAWDSIIPLEPMWKQLKRIIKPNGAIVMTASQPFASKLIISNVEMFRYCWVWIKSRPTGHLNSKKQPMRSHEDIVVFSINSCNYYPQEIRLSDTINKNSGIENVYGKVKRGFRQEETFTNYPTTLLGFSSLPNPLLHPTQKPVALMEYLIRTYTNEGELVLDFTIGSGTTAVAAKRTNRNFIGFELSEEYCEIARKRIQTAPVPLFV